MDWQNENQAAAQIIYNWRKEDTNGELTEPCTLDAIIYDELEDGAELDNDAIFDALAVESKRLERTAQIIGRSLNRTSSTLEIVENGIHVSKPMRKNGVTNIAIIYELTDGQTVSVLFHNPDTTPNKLKPDDMMIAWRWLLNRKDITIVVAKEKGRDLPIQQIANRVMALADKNTARFAKANAKKAEETQLIKALEEENAKLEERLEHLNKLAEEKENDANPENIKENQEDTEMPLNDAPIELTGKEFGYSENMSIDELREKAIQHLETTMRNDWVDVPALKQVEETTKVQLRKRGFNHIKEHSPSPEKLLILSKIKQLLSTSKYLYSANNVKTNKKPDVEKYHYLSKQFKFKGELFTCVIVIEKDQDGMLHYDILMDKYAQLHLNKAKEKMATHSTQERSLGNEQPSNQPESSGVFDNTAIFDEAQEKYVLNLFIFDENGNEIKDEEENSEDEEVSGSLNDKFDKQCNERKKEFISMLAVSQNDLEEEIKRVNSVKKYFTNEAYARAIRNAKLTVLERKYSDLIHNDEKRFKEGDIVWEVEPTTSNGDYCLADDFDDELISAKDRVNSLELCDYLVTFKRNNPNDIDICTSLSMAVPKAAVEAFEELKKQYEDEIELKQPENAQSQTENEIDEKQERESQENNLTPLVLPENATPKMLADSVSQWLKQNVQGKVINTSDGKKVFFNRRESIDHLTFDGRRSRLAAQAIGYIVDVFSKGDFVEREEIYKQRKDGFVAFHKYQKWVDIENKRVLLEAKAGEKEDGTLEIADGNKLIAYHHKVVAMDSLKNKGHFLPSIKSMDLNGELAPSREYAMDSTHDEIDDKAVLTILQVIDENGNEIKDEEDEDDSGSLNDELNNEKERALNNPLDDDLFNGVLRKLKEKNKESEVLSIERNQEIGKQFIDDAVGNQLSDFDKEAFETAKESMNNLTELLNTVENTHYLDSYFYSKDEEQFLDLINKVNQESGLSDLREKTKQLIDEHYRKNKEYGETEEGEKSFQDELAKLTKEAKKLVKIRNKKYLEQLPEYDKYKELKKEIEKLENTSFKAGNAIIDALNKNSSISEEDALEWAKNNVIIDKAVISRLNKDRFTNYPKEKILKDAADFYRLTNGRIGTINIKTKGGHRAYTGGIYSRDVKTIYVSGSFDKKSLWHEMGHHIEFDDKAGAVAHKFLKEKSVDGKLYPLNKILKTARYKRDEQAYKGDFISPYIGKYYSDGETEVFSMGLEYLSDTKTATYLLAKDPKMAQAIIGYLSQEKSEVLDFSLKHTKLRIDAEKEQEEKKQENEKKELAQILNNHPITDDLREYVDKRVEKVYSIRMKKGSRYAILGTFKSNEKNAIFAVVQLNAMKHFGRYGRGYVLMPTDGNRGDAIFYNTNDLVDEIKNYYL